MKDQINTIREALNNSTSLLSALGSRTDSIVVACLDGNKQALAALDQIETMVGEQEPKFWYRPVGNDGLYEGPVHHNSVGGKMLRDEKPGEWVPLFAGAAPVAQQPQEPDWKHPKIQALIGADARNRIVIDLIWQILKNPEGDFSAMDMEYWDSIHDAVQAAVTNAQQPQAEVKLNYFWIQEYARQHGVDYNELCALVRKVVKAPQQAEAVTEDGPPGSGGWERWALEMERQRNHYMQRCDTMYKHQNGSVWYWQGDGEDHLESMGNAMLVVIRADQMRALTPQQAEAVPPTHVLVPVELLCRVLDSEEVDAMADASDELRAMIDAAIAQQKGQP